MGVSSEEVDCPICLDPMDESDHQHALMCETRQCDFNFCHTCIESLITSSKDEYIEASDGNMHVKIFLHCPNCRSDLGPTIRETLLLRKADFLLASEHLSDEELTASQLRMRNVMGDPEVRKAIEVARKRESDFFKQKYPAQNTALEAAPSQGDENAKEVEYEEWGVEADLLGVHQSFRAPKAGVKDQPKIDKTLFRGLDFTMTEPEKLYVTELMTSGETDKLAKAATILRGILNVERGDPETIKRPVLLKRSSVFELIQEAEEAYTKRKGVAPKSAVVPKVTPAQIQASMKRQSDFLKLHPLPVRMPKEVELTVPQEGQKFGLGFCDDTWNGSVMDAYSKINISRGNKVHKKRSTNRGVRNVLSQGNPDEEFGDARIDVEKDRVLVSSVKGEPGRLGILKGDVVTHLNGETFTGTAADLRDTIKTMSEKTQLSTFALTLNAERSVAEALRRRASINGSAYNL